MVRAKKKPEEKIRLVIGVPTTGYTRIEWVESLVELQKELAKDPRIEHFQILYYCSSVIPQNRQKIVHMAKAVKATHLFWVDDDMRFPPLAFKALLHTMLRNKDSLFILGANCIKRTYPITWMATSHDDKEVNSYEKEGIEKVLYTGNSFVLVNMKVYDKMPEPWYAFPWHQHTMGFGTEDVYFMVKAAEVGFDTYVDHDVSKLIDHVGPHVFQPQHIESMPKLAVKNESPD